ncbi:MAG: hypothetical protein H7Y06_00135 [Opitutaceae bacterium]|nr:hypothetical protein [Opitutaceae bacterium]
MNTTPPALPDYASSVPAKKKTARGFFPPAIIKTVSFCIISLCILAGVVVSILAIWDFTRQDTLWRFASSFLVIAAGTLLFAFLNGIFGDRTDT